MAEELLIIVNLSCMEALLSWTMILFYGLQRDEGSSKIKLSILFIEILAFLTNPDE